MKASKVHLIIFIISIFGIIALFWYDYTHDLPRNPDSLAIISVVGMIYTGLMYAGLSAVYYIGAGSLWLLRRLAR